MSALRKRLQTLPRTGPLALCWACLLLNQSPVAADDPDPLPGLPSIEVGVTVESGPVENVNEAVSLVFGQTIEIADAPWVRLNFAKAVLSGRPEKNDGSFIVVTSLGDDAVQELDSFQIAQWGMKSAYFNGGRVKVEVFSHPQTGLNEISINFVTAGVKPGGQGGSICGSVDDRILSNDPRSARILPVGCTAFMINDPNHCILTAGHCADPDPARMQICEFNVPLSTDGGSLLHPPPQDQYPLDQTSVQFNYGGIGNDWCYFGLLPSAGMTAFERQGSAYNLAVSAPPVTTPRQSIRITGYGTDFSPPRQNQVQQTNTGPYASQFGTTISYQVDTTGGNSGSGVQLAASGEIIGIHTNAGCTASGGSNQGTAIQNVDLRAALANPRGVCVPFLRGDADTSTEIDISDAIFLGSYLFLGGTVPPCKEAADANDDGVIDITDLIYVLSYAFQGGPAPPAPGPFTPGPDPGNSRRFLGCLKYPG